MPSVFAALLSLCCIAKNLSEVWKGAGCSGQLTEIKFCCTERNDCPAIHERHNASNNWISNCGLKMAFSNSNHQLQFVVKILAAAERERGLDVGRHFGEIHFTVFRLREFDDPVAGFVNALILVPKTAQGFDEKAAGTASGVGHADFKQLRHEFFSTLEIAFLAAHGFAYFVRDFSGKGVDERIGHRAGDAGGRVINALVLAVGGKEHFIALAENVLVNAAVVVVDDAAFEGVVPGVDAEDEIELVTKALEVGRILVEPVPDAGGENLGIVVFVKKFLKLGQEFGDDLVRALGLPVAGVLDVGILRVAVGNKAEILDGAGEDELVNEQDDGFILEFRRSPFDFFKFIEPFFEVVKELLLQFRFFGGVFKTAHGVENAAGIPAAREKIRERLFGERLLLQIEIARTEKPRGAEVGEDDVFIVAEVFSDLGDVVFWFRIIAPA